MKHEIVTKNGTAHITVSYDYYGERIIDTIRFRVLQKPYELRKYIEECGIIGAQVLDIKLCFGTFHFRDFSLTCDIDELKELDLESVPAEIELDTPITIITDKGTFELDFVDASTVFFTNSGLMFDRAAFPEIEDSIDITTLFSSIIGKKIVSYEIEEGKEHSFFTWSYGLELDNNQDSYIWNLSLILEDGKRLHLYADFDWCVLKLLDENREVVKIKVDKLLASSK